MKHLIKQARKEQKLKRKNFLPTLLITAFFWMILGLIVFFVDPESFGILPTFFILIFFTLLFTFSLIFASSRRGFLISFSVVLFLILSYFGIGNILNFVLLVAIAVSIELYFSLR